MKNFFPLVLDKFEHGMWLSQPKVSLENASINLENWRVKTSMRTLCNAIVCCFWVYEQTEKIESKSWNILQCLDTLPTVSEKCN